MNPAGVFVTHVLSERIERHYARLVRETRGQVDWHLVVDSGEGNLQSTTLSAAPAPTVLKRRFRQMRRSGSIHGGFLDTLLWPWLLAPDTDHVWMIEYDVDYSGDWSAFFRQFETSTADLLTTTIVPRRLSADWWWWHNAAAPAKVPTEAMHRAFQPLMRLSRSFARHYVAEMQQPGWKGHYEFTVPTSAISGGFEVEDIGGGGPFCPGARRNRNYANSPHDFRLMPGTFIWRPAKDHYFNERPEEFPRADLLYHPVKPEVENWDAHAVHRSKSLRSRLKRLLPWR